MTEIDLNRQYIAMPTAKIIWLLLTTHEKNMAMQDPESPMLIGHLQPEDQVHDAKQECWIDPQIGMDLV